MVTRVGIIGISDGNGHPFSFSAIINGYDEQGMRESGWPVIHKYLSARKPEDFGVGDMRVVSAWTQERSQTLRLCKACRIEDAPDTPIDMIGGVDLVLIARDDWESHWDHAKPFLEAGIPVFVDKPLCVDAATFKRFAPHLASGKLMSASGLRFAAELSMLKGQLEDYGELRLIRAAIVNDWEKYGIHLIDGLLSITQLDPVAVVPVPAGGQSLVLESENTCPILIQALGSIAGVFQFDLYGSKKTSSHWVSDNFTMFRELLNRVYESVSGTKALRSTEETMTSLSILIAGRRALHENRRITLDEVRTQCGI